jgi:DNA modification methylase
VLDPFAGSGTVGRVAIELNRKAILNDLAYHDLSEKRTKNVQRSLI